uniref:Rho GTPase-activating protein 25-like n=1 Tax=Sinocyclocheilus rhinocerous TaxID=307959 RepID=A0A673G716_9TELE
SALGQSQPVCKYLSSRSKSVMPGEGSPGSTHTGFKRSMEKPLKTGWLKKQRSIVKNWQLRFFVLRGNVLTYHKDDRENIMGYYFICWRVKLYSCFVPDASGSSTDRERDAYVLMATSQSEIEEWVRSIRKAIGSRSNGVFGKSLSDIMVYEKKFGSRLVPILVEKCAEFIREQGLIEEGIFRLPGQDNQVKQFREAFDAGERPSFPSDTDVHTVASLLKLYLRELPEPVVPWTQYQDFLDSTLMLDAATAAGKEKLEEQISLLPKVNYNLLSYICRFLFEVQQNSKVNKMSVENLATVMGVNLFKPQVEDAIRTPMIQKVMTVMIRHHELLFPPSKDMLPSPLPSKKNKSKKNSNPRSFVGWESAELSSLSESPEEEEMDTPEEERKDLWSSETGSEGTSISPTSPFSSTTDMWPDSPRKRTQTLPSLGCPSVGKTVREPSWEHWSRFQESFNENEEKTFSEDIFKLLDLQKVTLFSGGQKSEKEKVEGQKDTEDTGLHMTVSDVVDKQIDALKTQALSTTPLPKPRPSNEVSAAAVSREKPAAPSQKNKELSATVTELQAALEAERRCKAALEILLRNAERSRDEALMHNERLNREIQEFLSRPITGPS